MTRRTIAVIPARGGSKSIPRKNLVDVAGKPLVAHMIGHALEVPDITDVVVSTDDPKIADTAKSFGAQVPFKRPDDLSGDDVLSLPVVQHAVAFMEAAAGDLYDAVVVLQATAPLCRPQDIRACLNRLSEGDCDSVVSVVRITSNHPFRMKRIVDGDVLINFLDQGFEDVRPRQQLPPVYKRSGAVYASTRATVMDDGQIVGNRARAVIVPEDTAVDIDTPLDLALVRLIVEEKADSI